MKIRFILPLFLSFVFALTACQSENTQKTESNATGTSESASSCAASEPEEESKSNVGEQLKPKNLKEYLSDNKNVETVLCFSGNSEDTISFHYIRDNSGEKESASIITEYLQERGMFKEEPDGTSFVDGICSIEYYTDSEKQKYSVIRRWFDESDNSMSVYATTYALDGFIELGDIVFDCNANGDVVSEKFYNTTGDLTSDITYKYYKNIPFPFISKHIITDESGYELLNRGQRFWFYKDFAVKGETGEVIEYTQDIYSNKYREGLFDISINFTYDANGRLNVLSEDFIAEEDDSIHEENWTSDILSLEYYENGALKKADYCFEWTFSFELPQNQRNRGTWYSSGEINYDENGRAVYRRDYVTHGSHYSFYLYDGDSKRPCAYIELCSMSCGNETPVLIYRTVK